MINKFAGAYHFLSNFAHSPITLSISHDKSYGEWEYPTVEHFFQAAKVISYDDRDTIRLASTASEAKKLGRQFRMHAIWDTLKLDVMRAALGSKFAPGTDLAESLLLTRGEILIEGNTWEDRFW